MSAAEGLKDLEQLNISEDNKQLYMKEALRLDNQLCFPLYACARMVTGLYTPYLKPLGITYTQYLVLMVLWEHDNINVGDLCRKLFLDSGTITPLLKKMEEKSYVVRQRCPRDERCVQVSLTKAGRDLREKALMIPAQVGACVRLSMEDAAELKRLLGLIMGNME